MKITRTFVIEIELWEKLRDRAFTEHKSISELLRDIITNYLK